MSKPMAVLWFFWNIKVPTQGRKPRIASKWNPLWPEICQKRPWWTKSSSLMWKKKNIEVNQNSKGPELFLTITIQTQTAEWIVFSRPSPQCKNLHLRPWWKFHSFSYGENEFVCRVIWKLIADFGNFGLSGFPNQRENNLLCEKTSLKSSKSFVESSIEHIQLAIAEENEYEQRKICRSPLWTFQTRRILMQGWFKKVNQTLLHKCETFEGSLHGKNEASGYGGRGVWNQDVSVLLIHFGSSDYQVPLQWHQIFDFSIESSLSSTRTLIETMMEIKAIFMEKHAFEYRNGSKFLTFLDI